MKIRIAAGFLGTLALGVMLLGGCMAEPKNRSATEAPINASTVTDTGSVSCSDGGMPQFTISGTVTDAQGIGAITDARVFVIGLPCRQVAPSDNGAFTLTLSDADVAATGFGEESVVTLIAWLVQTPFASVVAASQPVKIAASGTDAGTLTMDWASAAHVTVNFSDGSTFASATFPGIADSEAHGFAMTGPPTQGNTFDTNYVPAGTYTLEIETEEGATYQVNLYFRPFTSANGWFFPTINL